MNLNKVMKKIPIPSIDDVVHTVAQSAGVFIDHRVEHRKIGVGFDDQAHDKSPMYLMEPEDAIRIGGYFLKRGIRAVTKNGFEDGRK